MSEQDRRQLNLATGRPGIITSVAFSFDGTRIATGSSMWRPDETPGGVIQRWDSANGNAVGEPMHPPEGSVIAVSFSPLAHGNVVNQIASGDSDYHVRLWDADAKTGRQMGGPLRGHQNGVVSVVFTPGAKCIVSGSIDGTVRIWPNPPTEAPESALRDKVARPNDH
jgi:WD40 repeat protein